MLGPLGHASNNALSCERWNEFRRHPLSDPKQSPTSFLDLE